MNTDPPLFRALAAQLGHPHGTHHYRDDPPDTEEVPIMGRHSDVDGDGVMTDVDRTAADSDFDPEHAYEFPDPGWRAESDFTGEWVGQHVARLPRGAAARTGVTAATLRAAMGADLPLGKHPTLVADFNAALLAAGCTTVNRAAMFAAQVGHESLGLRYFEELWGPTAQQRRYEPVTSLSKQLGNTAPGDGSRFRGRGPIQLTGRGGYVTFLGWCRAQGYRPPDFLVDPGQVAMSRWGFLAASHYWTVRRPGLNAASDSGSVEAATRLVNGGTYGLEDRRRRYQACLRLGNALLPGASPAPAPPRPKGIPKMIERPLPPGNSSGRVACPTGAASDIVARAWASVTVDGGARVELWAQRANPGADTPTGAAKKELAERDWTLHRGDRAWFELPSGTEYLTYRVTGASGPGSLLVEQTAK